MFKRQQIKLFFITLVTLIGVGNIDLALANNIFSEPNINSHRTAQPPTRVIVNEIDNSRDNLIFTSSNSRVLIAKKSGGRSRGGSFKSKSSKSSSPKRSSSSNSNSNQRKSTTPSSTYRNSTPVPTYRDRQLNSPANNVYIRGKRHTGGNIIGSILFFLMGGVCIFVFLRIIFKVFSAISSPQNRTNQKIVKERDNDRVTVSMLQIAVSSQAENIQEDLSELSLTTDTDTDEGLVELMRESALILLRNDHAWTHVLSSSNSLDINQAEEEFDKLSFAERSKFSSETLSNVDGKIKTRRSSDSSSDNFPGYVVVTLILGTADDNPLFTMINTEESLKEVLLKLSSMREDYLMKFELLWTPQTSQEYLTDEELLMEYTNLTLLA